MSISVFLLWLVSVPLLVQGNAIIRSVAGRHAQPKPQVKDYFVNCGSNEDVDSWELKYLADDAFISPQGTKTATINQTDVLPILSTLRYIPDKTTKKKCYKFQALKGGKYLVKSIFYYGNFDGGTNPPVFDLIIEGTKWSTVNTTQDYLNGLASFYEIIVMARDEKLSVCLAWNDHTVSSPFISALQVHSLNDLMYDGTNFDKYALMTVARHSFAAHGETIGFPDDKFGRYWYPFIDNNPVVSSHSNVTPSVFFNNPPAKIFERAITTDRGKSLQVMWPPYSVPASRYYIALYLQDSRAPSPYSWGVFDIQINGETFYRQLNVTTSGAMVFSTFWPLNGTTTITLTPRSDIPVGPLINAAEAFQLLALEERTAARDVIVMDDIVRSIQHLPLDWEGDPCVPRGNAWTGVTCRHRLTTHIVSLNLTGLGVLTGTLPKSLSNLSALHHLWLGGNSLTGSIPDLSPLMALETLHLENNQFEGPIPESLGHLPKLREVFLQNNKFTGDIPASLKNRRDILLK
ncbi:unnamed protein product [Coffea canephora]|uniref:Malectin-like domain-containing protein n=1 Tax=Coffea canephora TaxID=49390 RepID=A0A068TLW1_COFCA|nr:unnamed protein product [Coffea canephora]